MQAKKAVFTTFNLGAEALRASKLLRMATPVERRLLLKAILTDTRGACVQLDDTRTPKSRRDGEDLFTTPLSSPGFDGGFCSHAPTVAGAVIVSAAVAAASCAVSYSAGGMRPSWP